MKLILISVIAGLVLAAPAQAAELPSMKDVRRALDHEADPYTIKSCTTRKVVRRCKVRYYNVELPFDVINPDTGEWEVAVADWAEDHVRFTCRKRGIRINPIWAVATWGPRCR